MILEGLDCALCRIASMIVGRYKFEVDFLGSEVAFVGSACFIIESLVLWLESSLNEICVYLVVCSDVL
jgi:hypothetical protein